MQKTSKLIFENNINIRKIIKIFDIIAKINILIES